MSKSVIATSRPKLHSILHTVTQFIDRQHKMCFTMTLLYSLHGTHYIYLYAFYLIYIYKICVLCGYNDKMRIAMTCNNMQCEMDLFEIQYFFSLFVSGLFCLCANCKLFQKNLVLHVLYWVSKNFETSFPAGKKAAENYFEIIIILSHSFIF